MADTARLPGCNEQSWQWQLHAACRGMDGSLFFSPDTERDRRRERRETAAKANCARCPVIVDCRNHAFKVRESDGIWGGMTETERAGLPIRGRRLPLSPAESPPRRGRLPGEVPVKSIRAASPSMVTATSMGMSSSVKPSPSSSVAAR